jgi:hypothetical protein
MFACLTNKTKERIDIYFLILEGLRKDIFFPFYWRSSSIFVKRSSFISFQREREREREREIGLLSDIECTSVTLMAQLRYTQKFTRFITWLINFKLKLAHMHMHFAKTKNI